jgi:hypothetical protein
MVRGQRHTDGMEGRSPDLIPDRDPRSQHPAGHGLKRDARRPSIKQGVATSVRSSTPECRAP